LRETSFKNHQGETKKLEQYKEFKKLLLIKTNRFSKFPKYVLDILAMEMELNKFQKTKIIKRLLNEEILLPLKNGLFKVN
jgi:hypothetical protein